MHVFVKAHPTDSPSNVANQFKELTSRVWSRTYFVATVGAVSASGVQRYIDTQFEQPWRKEHEK